MASDNSKAWLNSWSMGSGFEKSSVAFFAVVFWDTVVLPFSWAEEALWVIPLDRSSGSRQSIHNSSKCLPQKNYIKYTGTRRYCLAYLKCFTLLLLVVSHCKYAIMKKPFFHTFSLVGRNIFFVEKGPGKGINHWKIVFCLAVFNRDVGILDPMGFLTKKTPYLFPTGCFLFLWHVEQ